MKPPFARAISLLALGLPACPLAHAGSAVLPISVPLDIFEFVPSGQYSRLPPSYIAFYGNNGNSFSFPQGESYSYNAAADSDLAAYDIFAPDGEVTDPAVGAYSDFGANAFFYGGNASWTGGYIEYGLNGSPMAYDQSVSLQSMNLEFYSPFALPNSRLYVFITPHSISDYVLGFEDPNVTGSWLYDTAGYGNPLVAAAPDRGATALLLVIAFGGVAALGQGKRRLVPFEA
jgi:hypothetical protein